MNIGIIIGRIGDVDGVALETEKWAEVLTKMGHEIFILSVISKGCDRTGEPEGTSVSFILFPRVRMGAEPGLFLSTG